MEKLWTSEDGSVRGRLFHGTVVEFPVEAILEPGHPKRHRQSAEDAVSVTSDPERAAHWAKEAAKAGGFPQAYVYEVEPLGKVLVWREGHANFGKDTVLYEGRVESAVVSRMVFGPGVDELPAFPDWMLAQGFRRDALSRATKGKELEAEGVGLG